MIAAKLAPDWIKRVLNVLIPFLLLLGLIAAISWYIQRIDHQRELAVKNLETMTENYERADEAAKANADALKLVNDLRVIDAETMARLSEANESLTKSTAQQTAARKDLGAKNVAVKTYLDQPVPADLRLLLNRQAAKYRGSNQGRASVSSVGITAGTGVTDAGRGPDN